MSNNPQCMEPRLALHEAWQRLRESEPNLRARDLAGRLGVSEGELVASRCGQGVIRLQGPWSGLIHALPALGKVMALTRNASCVHEKKGRFDHIEIGRVMGVVLNEAIDLRLFLKHWQHGFAVTETSHGRDLSSLQFFDGDGTAVHKIYCTAHSDAVAWNGLIERFRCAEQAPDFNLTTVDPPLSESLCDNEVNIASLREGWRAMRDPHDFFALLKRHKVTRTQGLRLAGEAFAQRVCNHAFGMVLDAAASSGLPLMLFVGSPGVVQIHTGPVHQVKRIGAWLNVLDDDFNLHLREDHIAESWVVQKPSPEGTVTSLELYDADGTQILQVFGKRKPGVAQLPAWRALADNLPRVESHHA